MCDVEKFSDYEEWRMYLEAYKPEYITIFHFIKDLLENYKITYYIVRYQKKAIIGIPFINKEKLFLRFMDSSIYTLPFLGAVLFDKKFLLKNNAESKECISLLTHSIIDYSKFNVIRVINPPYLVDVRHFLWNGWRAEVSYTYAVNPKSVSISSHTMKFIRRGLKLNPKIEHNNLDLSSLISMYEMFSKRKGFYAEELHNVVKSVLLYGIEHDLLTVTNVFDKEGDYSVEVFFIDPITKIAYRLYAFSSDTATRKFYNYLAIWESILVLKDKNDVDAVYLLAAPSYNLSIFASKFADDIVPYFWLLFVKPQIPFFVLRKIGIQTYPWL